MPLIQNIKIDVHNVDNYVKTDISAIIYNPAPKPQELNFTFIVPNGALVSNLTMTIANKEYYAKLKSIAEASATYEKQKHDNKTAFFLKINFTASQEVLLQSNIQGYSEATFKLTYEEHLKSSNNIYKQKISLDTQSFTRNLTGNFWFSLNGNRNMTFFQIDSAHFTNKENKLQKINVYRITLKPINVTTDSKGRIVKEFDVYYGLSDPEEPNTIIGQDYFSHFFLPEALLTYPKHVVFVLDVSGSMVEYNRLNNTKLAMTTLLGSLKDRDYFTIITFSTGVDIWPKNYNKVYQGTSRNLALADKYVFNLAPGGMTNINGGLTEGMKASKEFRNSRLWMDKIFQLIFFMTDGYANHGDATSAHGILQNLREFNYQLKVHGLAFGSDADFNLVKYISTGMNGHAMQ